MSDKYLVPSDAYDSYRGILDYLSQGMLGLHRLVARRHDAGYKRKERMVEWVIMGRWFLDSCGNAGTFTKEFIPAVEFPKEGFSVWMAMTAGEFKVRMSAYNRSAEPNVLTREELDDMYSMKWDDPGRKKYESRPYPISYTVSYNFDVPYLLSRCPVCGKGWNIENCHDVHLPQAKSECVPLDKYVGMTLAQWRRKVLRHRARKQGVVSRMGWDHFLRNDKYINTTLAPNCTATEVNHGGYVSEKGSVPTVSRNDHIIEKGDEACLHTWTHYHKECWKIHQEHEERDYFAKICEAAGFVFAMTPIPNEYCPCESCAPWYMIEFQLVVDKRPVAEGFIKIGWRKRVINIDISKVTTSGIHLNLSTLFADEDVTKGLDHIHAWGKEKCIEYLTKIRQELLK